MADRCAASVPGGERLAAELAARRAVVGHHRAHHVPEARRCGSSRAGARARGRRRSRWSAARSGSAASAGGSSRRRWRCPSASAPSESDSRVTRTPSRAREVGAALLEHAARLALQPALHGVADLLGRGAVRQADVQRGAATPRQRRRRRRPRAAPRRRRARAASSMTIDRLAEERQRRAVAPDDRAAAARCARARCCSASLRRIQPPFSRTAASMSRSVTQLRRAAPLRPSSADDEADAAPARALSRKAMRRPSSTSSRLARGWRSRVGGRRRASTAGQRAASSASNRPRCSTSAMRRRPRAIGPLTDRPPDRGGASRPRSRSRPRASARRRSRPVEAIGLPIETSITPGPQHEALARPAARRGHRDRHAPAGRSRPRAACRRSCTCPGRRAACACLRET